MITLLLLVFPIIAALILFYAAKNKASGSAGLAEFMAIIELGIYVWGQATYNLNPADAQLVINQPWISDLSINFNLGWNGLSALMLALSSAVSLLIIFSLRTLKYANKNQLYALIFLSQAILVGVFAAKDIFVFYFFFEAALIPVYLIANIWGGENASKITFKMFIYTVFGSLFMLVAFVMIYMRAQTSDIDTLHTAVALMPISTKQFVFWAILLAFCIKMPIFPLHTWLPDAYSQSPTPATMLMSGLLSKMGVFGLIRVLLPFGTENVHQYGHVVMLLAIVGLIYGSIIAIQQDNLKRLIAYSSLAHMGIMAAAVMTRSTEGLQGSIFQMVAHGFNVVGLFYVAKIIYDRTGSRNLNTLGGITQSAPILSVAFMIILLGSVALPLTNGFIGEFLMLKSIFDFNNIMGFVAGLSIILGAVYMLRFFQRSMFGENKVGNIADLTVSELTVLIPIILVILVTGLFPNIVLQISEPFVNQLISK